MQAVVIKEDRREKSISVVWVEGESESRAGHKTEVLRLVQLIVLAFDRRHVIRFRGRVCMFLAWGTHMRRGTVPLVMEG